ncbi:MULTISPECIES: hypothetical protein [unclassified Lysinibacillus]|nr:MULTISPECIES: hypothetical protein [unclassified Lysinibacillus]
MGIWIVIILVVAVVFMLFQAELTYIKADKSKKMSNKIREEE